MRHLRPKQWADLINSGNATIDDVPDTEYKDSTIKEQVMETLGTSKQPEPDDFFTEPEPDRPAKRSRRTTE